MTTAPYEPGDQAATDAQQVDDANRTPQDWGRYRAKEKEAREAADKASKLERENAFLKAGINPSDKDAPPHTQLFVDAYKGDLDPKAIQAEAVKMNILKADAPAPDPATQQTQQDAAAAAKKIDQASQGAQPESGSDPITKIDDAFNEGGNEAVAAELRSMGIPTVHSA